MDIRDGGHEITSILGWRHLTNNLHTLAKMAASILRPCIKNREKYSALVPPIFIKNNA